MICRIFLDKRLKEPDFKLIKPSMDQVLHSTAKQLTGNENNKQRNKKMKRRLSFETLVHLHVPNGEEVGEGSTPEELTPSSPPGATLQCHSFPPPKKALCLLAPDLRAPHLSGGGVAHPEHEWTLTNKLPGRTPSTTASTGRNTNTTAAHSTEHIEGHQLPDRIANEDAVKG